MPKGIINTAVDYQAKEGFECAAKPLFGEKGSTARVVENVGLQLKSRMDALHAMFPDGLPPCRLVVSVETEEKAA